MMNERSRARSKRLGHTILPLTSCAALAPHFIPDRTLELIVRPLEQLIFALQIASLESRAEPAHALLRRAVRESVRDHIALGLHLQTIIANRVRRRDG